MEGDKVTFVKKDLLLWHKHCPFLTEDQWKEGVVMLLPSGRELAFKPPVAGKKYPTLVLEPADDSNGYTEWVKGIQYGQVLEVELV